MTNCCWIGNGEGCGAECLPDRSYCLEHLTRVYKQGTARARRKKEIQTVNKVRIVENLLNEALQELEAEGFDCYGERELGLEEL
jgi:hypothetical protein